MKRPNITPGEWNTHLGILKSSQEEQLADLRVPVSPFTSLPEKEVREANARAIAALPALLTALEALHAIGKDGVAMRHETGKPTWSALEETKKLTQAALIEAGYTF